MSELLIYGAYGYSGRQIVAAAMRRGLRPIVAGRDARQVAAVGEEFRLPYRSFALGDAAQLSTGLAGVGVVLHCAGPFSATAAPMLDACLAQRAHYLDITGEYGVMEAVAARDGELRAAGIMAMSGVGMDVVPSDCLAAHMVKRLPGATRLELYVRALERLSRGTAMTFVEGMGLPNVVRENGRLVERIAGADRRQVEFGGRRLAMVGVPWGDIATAWHTTRIPDIAAYMSLVPGTPTMMSLAGHFRGLLQSRPVQRFLKGLVQRFVKGPDQGYLDRHTAEFIAEVSDAAGNRRRSYLSTPEAYKFTAEAASEIAKRVLEGAVQPGFQTPGTLFGADFVLEFAGTKRVDLD